MAAKPKPSGDSSAAGMVEIGVISDTHGLLRPEALRALEGVALILHAGDVCSGEILRELEEIAPVNCVRGNCDNGVFGETLPLAHTVELGGVWIYMHHGHHTLAIEPASAGFGVVISGHTHVPRISEGNGVLWLNPGSAGPPRFHLPVTLARLTVGGGKARARLVHLLEETLH